MTLTDALKQLILSHLSQLKAQFSSYFGDLKPTQYDWVRYPFADFSDKVPNLSSKAEEELIGLASDRTLKLKIETMSIIKFWISVQTEYPLLYKAATQVLLPFPTSYL